MQTTLVERERTHTLTIALRGAGGEILGLEAVRPADLADARAETWWRVGPLRGRPELPRSAVQTELRPILSSSAGSSSPCVGFALDAWVAGDAQRETCVFGRYALEPVVRRAIARALREGRLAADAEEPTWELLAGVPGVHAPARETSGVRLVGVARDATPECIQFPLAPLLARASEIDAPGERDHVVLYTREARAAAERISRGGEDRDPPVEAGGLLIGKLGLCPERRTTYVVVSAALEALGAEGTTFSLSFSGASWSRLQTILAARRRRPQGAGLIVLGQAHGHPFVVGGAAPGCADCPARAGTCSRSSAFLSDDDRSWCRATFAGTPHQVSHVFGQDPLGRRPDAFYGQRGGELVRRGYHAIDARDLPPELRG